MTLIHQSLSQTTWENYSIFEQMANIGADVGRAIIWKKKGNQQMSQKALYRSLELLDFTINDRKNIIRLKELTRVREMLVDYFIGENIYKSTDESWNKYFYSFNFAARNK